MNCFSDTNTLPFRLISVSELSGLDQDALFGLQDTKLNVATLQLGNESITLTEHAGHHGKPIPPDSRSFDHWFQHISIFAWFMLPSPFLILLAGGCAFVLLLSGIWYARAAGKQ